MHIGASLGRVLTSWLLSALVAIPLGLAMGRFRLFEKLVDPLVELFRPISPLAWIPLAILWFGIGIKSAAFIIFLGAFFPILLNTTNGVLAIDPVLIEAARVTGSGIHQPVPGTIRQILEIGIGECILGNRCHDRRCHKP